MTDTGVSTVSPIGGGYSVYSLNSVQLTISPSYLLPSGATSTGTVFLPVAAGPNGARVALYTEDDTTQVPASVYVAPGAQTATFSFKTASVPTVTTGFVDAYYNGGWSTAAVTVQPATPSSVTLSPTTFVGGTKTVVTGTVTFSAPVAVDTPVNLTSSEPTVGVPATVVVPAGAASVTFPVTTGFVNSDRVVNVTAAWNGFAQSGSATDQQLQVSTLVVSPKSVNGGVGAIGQVTLAAVPATDATVTLTVDHPELVTLPATVTVPAGSKTASFNLTTILAANTVPCNLVAAFNGSQASAPLTVKQVINIASLKFPGTSLGLQTLTGSVTLNQAGPNDLVIALASDNPAITLPASVTVPAGTTTVSFTATTSDVTSAQLTHVSAGLGLSSRTVSCTVNSNDLIAFTLSPKSVKGGPNVTITGTLKIKGAVTAPAVVALTSSDPTNVPVPTSVSISAGQATVTFTLTVAAVAADETVTITANRNGISIPITITVKH